MHCKVITPSNFNEAEFELRGGRWDAVLVPVGKRDEYMADVMLRRLVHCVTDRVLFFDEGSA